MRLRTKAITFFLLCASCLLYLPTGLVHAFSLRPQPPANQLVMNLDLLPTTPFQSLGYGIQSWSSLAEGALATWNQVGIGTPPDHGFFLKRLPVVLGDPCSQDGINEVRFASSVCGMAWGDAIGITFWWIINGKVVETDVQFNSLMPLNAYPGPILPANSSQQPLIDFFRLALHEFGHAAGLLHPNDFGENVVAIMNRGNQFVGNAVDNLQPDDIAGAHSILWPPNASPPPDLVSSIDPIPSTGTVGGTIQLSATVRNQGTGSAGAFRLGFYFSSNTTITTGDFFFAFCNIPGLAPGASVLCSGPVPIPASLPPGVYFVGVIADDQSTVAESNKGNNTAVTGPIAISGTSSSSAAAFVTRLYLQVLGRSPDPVGLQAFIDQIQQFGSVVPTVLAFFHSAEFLSRNTSNSQFLTILYQTFLNRSPDPTGFNAFLTALQTGQLTRDNLLDIFIDSQEFAAQASFLPPLDPVTAFVTTLYVRILGRGPDQAGLQGFVAQLRQTRTVLPTVQQFLASPEFLSRNTTNTEFVTLLYRVFLGRVPDSGGLTFFVTALNQGTATRDQLVLQFAASPEFQAIQQGLFP